MADETTKPLPLPDQAEIAPTTPFESTPDAVELLDAPLQPLALDDRYLHHRKLGHGGMGEVRLAKDRQVGREVAVKVIRREYAGDATILTRFVREARVQGQLEHPSIVPVYDLGVSPSGEAFFTMKRIRGVTLHDIVQKLAQHDAEAEQKYNRRRLLGAFASVCLAVDFAHQHGVLHRDLKPANVMLGDYGEVYVLDWGIAQVRGAAELPASTPAEGRPTAPALTEPGTVLGTMGYMAPEQLRGRTKEIGPASDVYALGAILFELLTLRALHPGGSVESVLESTMSSDRERASNVAADVPPELDEVCLHATARDVDRRFPTARALHDAIERYLDGARDEARRRELSIEHARRAREQTTRTLTGPKGAVHRSDAMREVGRALALDPENEDALRTMVTLLTRPPNVAPPEVEAALERSEEDQIRQQGLFGAVAYAAMIAFLPMIAWCGVIDWPTVTILFAMLAGAALLAYRVHKSEHPTQAQVFAVFLFSTVAFALTTRFFGPYVVTPAALAVNTTLYSINARRDVRWATIAVGAIVLAMVIGIEWVQGTSYRIDRTGIFVRPDAIAFSTIPTRVLLAVLCVSSVVSGPLALMGMRESLRRAQRLNELVSWQIRALVPEKARRAVPDSAR